MADQEDKELREIELQISESVKKMIDEKNIGGSMSNSPSLLEFANSLTVEDLIRIIPEIEAKFPKEKMAPNPADVHPATFAALRNVCEQRLVPRGDWPVLAIVLHVRPDVEPWKLHPCTCKKK